MSGKPPDRLSVEKGSRFYSKLGSQLIITIDGVVQTDSVLEYCVSGGWARCHVKDEAGKKLVGALGTRWQVKRVHGVIDVQWVS